MAERRMLHKKASVSSDLAELRVKHGSDALAFYLLMIPHMDRWGCVPDDAQALRILVIPAFDDVTTSDVKKWLAWMVRRGMLTRVTGPAGDRGLRSPDFHEHQRGTHFDRETPSLYEPADISKRWKRQNGKNGSYAGVSGPSPDKSGPSPLKGREGKVNLPLPFPPSPPVAEGPATSPDPSPGAQAQSPRVEVNGNGKSHDDERRPRLVDANGGEPVKPARDALLAAVGNPALRAALERGGKA